MLTALLFILLDLSCLAQSKGVLTSRECPYSCKSEGISKNDCQDWREGNICYVKDLRMKPELNSQIINKGFKPTYAKRPIVATNSECKTGSNISIAAPYINLSSLKPYGGFFTNKQKAVGSVEGVCLVDAGYFENGRKVSDIPISTLKDFQRFDFNVQINSEHNPEIRVYNINGERDVLPFSDLNSKKH